MKKVILFFLVIFFCSHYAYSDNLYWFSAAGIKKPSAKIVDLYNKTHTDKVVLIAGGTGQILSQMIISKKGDIYTPIDSKFLDTAVKKNVIIDYVKIMKLTPVFGVCKEKGNLIKTFNDLAKKGVRIAVGNPKTMSLGKTSRYILSRLPNNIRHKIKNNVVVSAINISQIVNYVKTGSVDTGILFDAVAKTNDIDYIKIPEKYNQIKYGYVALVKFSKNKKRAKELFNFILSHKYIYKQYGFSMVK